MARFCTALLDDGQPCGYRARPGKNFCTGHSPDTSYLHRRCQYYNQRGRACEGIPIRGQNHCFTHSPRNRKAKYRPIPLRPRTQRDFERRNWLICGRLPLPLRRRAATDRGSAAYGCPEGQL